MIQHIRLLKFYFSRILTFFIILTSINCKKKEVSPLNNSKDTLSVINDSILNYDRNYKNELEKNEFLFELIEVKQISNNKPIDSIIDRLKKIKVHIKDNFINIDNVKAKFVVDKNNSKSFFGRDYLYKFYVDFLSKNYNINIKTNISYLEVGYEDSMKYPFKDFFFEGGVSIYMNDYLFLNYSDYVVVFKKSTNKESLNKSNVIKECIEPPKVNLPYSLSHQNYSEFKICKCKLDGVNEFLCDNEFLRYIPLIRTNGIDLILVPMNCADYSYRYYILSIKGNKIISNLYAEGEWFEPENFDNIEKTSFTIDKNSKIILKITNFIGKKLNSSTSKEYMVNQKGELIES